MDSISYHLRNEAQFGAKPRQNERFIFAAHTPITDTHTMRVVICDDLQVDSFGTRILSSGIVLTRYEKNPVVIYMHEYVVLPIGTLSDFKLEGSQLTAEFTPDKEDTDELTQRIISKLERGIINGFSVGGDILTESSDPKDMLPGQTEPTITGLMLYEVSIAIIPSNENAVVRRSYSGRVKPKKPETMDKEVRRALGLPEDAPESDVLRAVNNLQGKKKKKETPAEDPDPAEGGAEAAKEDGKTVKRIADLEKTVEEQNKTISGLTSLSSMIKRASGEGAQEPAQPVVDFSKMSFSEKVTYNLARKHEKENPKK